MNALSLIQATVEPGLERLDAGLHRLGFQGPKHKGTAFSHVFKIKARDWEPVVNEVKEFRDGSGGQPVYVELFGGTTLAKHMPVATQEILTFCTKLIHDLPGLARRSPNLEAFVASVNQDVLPAGGFQYGRVANYDEAAAYYHAYHR